MVVRVVKIAAMHQHNHCANESLQERLIARAAQACMLSFFWLAEGYYIFELYTLPIQDIRAHKRSGLL